MRILVLTLSFGSGHVSAARAVAKELTRLDPEAEVSVVDALKESRQLFRVFYAWPYFAMLRYAPSLWKKLFRRRVERRAQHTAPVWAIHWGFQKVLTTIAETRPDVIVATEVAACELSILARRVGLTSARIVNVITDHEAEPIWVQPEIEVYAVADEGVREQLIGWGAEAERTIVSGIPTDASFAVRHNATATRVRYGLSEDAPIVLLMGGGMGPVRMDEVAARLADTPVPVQVIAVAGHDSEMRRKLERVATTSSSLMVHGWIDEIAPLMQIASVLVTKPGGLTLAEAALSELPIVMFDAIPGPEFCNVEHVVAEGAGICATDPEEAVSATFALLADEHKRKRLSAAAKRSARPGAAGHIARLVLQDVSSLPTVRRTTA